MWDICFLTSQMSSMSQLSQKSFMSISRKRIIIVLLSFCVGYGAGWVACRVVTLTPLTYALRKAGITKAEMERMNSMVPYVMQKMDADDLASVTMSIAALDLLSEGKTDEAKKSLATIVAEFYVRHASMDIPEGQEISEGQKDILRFLKMIETTSETNPALKQAIGEATK